MNSLATATCVRELRAPKLQQHPPTTASQCGTAPVRTGVASSGTLSGAVASIPFPLKALTSTMLGPLGSTCNVSDTFAVRPSDGVANLQLIRLLTALQLAIWMVCGFHTPNKFIADAAAHVGERDGEVE